jgi:hypothetical protein
MIYLAIFLTVINLVLLIRLISINKRNAIKANDIFERLEINTFYIGGRIAELKDIATKLKEINNPK